MLYPARYFSTPLVPLPVAYYRQESQRDGEIILSELEDALADMRIDIAEDMRHDESMLEDQSETSWDDCDEGLEYMPLVEDNSTGLPIDEESRIQDDEPMENTSTAPLHHEESDIQTYKPTEENSAGLVIEEESTIQDNDSQQTVTTDPTPMSPRSVHLQ
jgi:hypothetical protein